MSSLLAGVAAMQWRAISTTMRTRSRPGSTPTPTWSSPTRLNSHDVGRGRGGCRAALERVTADLVVVAIDSDRLYPPRLSQEIARASASSGPLTSSPQIMVTMVSSSRSDRSGEILRESLSRPLGG